MFSPIVLAGAAVTALYGALGVVIVRRLRKPTCRICLYRGICPNRESEHGNATHKPCWSCSEATECTEPGPSSGA